MPFSIVLIAIYTVLPYPKTQDSIPSLLNNTSIWWLIRFAILWGFYSVYKNFITANLKRQMIWVMYYLIWNIIEITHGIFVAEDYWGWKGFVNNAMILCMPIVAYAASNTNLIQHLLWTYIKYCLPFAAVVFFLASPGGFGFFLAPIAYLLLFLPLVTKKWRMILLGICLLILAIDLDARSNIIKFAAPLLLLLFLPFKKLLFGKSLETIRLVFFFLPFILFYLGTSGVFNIFKIGESVDQNYVQVKENQQGEIVEIDLKMDTRTALYTEVLSTANKYNTWLWGRSPAKGNETELFAHVAEITGREERLSNEVAILNIFTWTGAIGVVLYFLVFYGASYLAVNKSKNIYIKLVGVFIAFRWLYAWIEDINNFSLNYFMLWIVIGMCYSPAFRNMNDLQMKYWVRSIFDIRYKKVLSKYNEYLEEKRNNKVLKKNNALV